MGFNMEDFIIVASGFFFLSTITLYCAWVRERLLADAYCDILDETIEKFSAASKDSGKLTAEINRIVADIDSKFERKQPRDSRGRYVKSSS
jgi:hypothetical protein